MSEFSITQQSNDALISVSAQGKVSVQVDGKMEDLGITMPLPIGNDVEYSFRVMHQIGAALHVANTRLALAVEALNIYARTPIVQSTAIAALAAIKGR